MVRIAHVPDADPLEPEDAARRGVARARRLRLILVVRGEQEVLPYREVALSVVAVSRREHARIAGVRDVEDPKARVAALVEPVPPEGEVRVRGPGVPGEGDVMHVGAVHVRRACGRGGAGRGNERGQKQDGNREANYGAHGA